MKKFGMKLITLGILGFLTAGCSDPLTKTLANNKYVAAIPAPATLHLGNVYDTADLQTPFVLLRDIFTEADNKKLMTSLMDDVSIADEHGEKTFNVTFDADIVGKAKIELQAHKISKFKVAFKGVKQYMISRTRFDDDLFPKIRLKFPGKSFDKKFAVVALLQIKELEYEFLNDNGGKVNVTPGSKIEKVLKAKLGIEWSANNSKNLSIKAPRFVGYRMARISKTVLGDSHLALTAATRDVWITEAIPLADLRNARR